MEPLPEKAAARPLPLEPSESCTVSTPSMSARTSSTFMAASSRTSRLLPSGRVCETVMVFCPLSPMKLVFSSGAARPVSTSTSTAESSVIAGRLRVKVMIGR